MKIRELKFFDPPEKRKKARRVFCFFLFLLAVLLVDSFMPKHGHFWWEEVPAFFAAWSFVACICLIFMAKVLRLAVKRREDYYD